MWLLEPLLRFDLQACAKHSDGSFDLGLRCEDDVDEEDRHARDRRSLDCVADAVRIRVDAGQGVEFELEQLEDIR